jgi:hypothetical protein
MEYREEISGHDRVPRMEEAGVIQNLFDSCDRGMTKHRSLLGKKFTALLDNMCGRDKERACPNLHSVG